MLPSTRAGASSLISSRGIHFPKPFETSSPAHHQESCSTEHSTLISSPSSPLHNVMSVYLRETPSHEPFNVDPDLVHILNKNQHVIDSNPPLFILHPTCSDQNGTNAQSSISLLHIITYTHLSKFRRFPQSEALYSREFSKKVKEKYGSSAAYLTGRLGFSTLPSNHPSNLRFDCHGQPIHYFTADPGLVDALDYKVIRNEWPYAIDRGYQHLTVWSRLKLLNPALSPSLHHWHLATEQGLSGFVNLSNHMKDRLKQFKLSGRPEDLFPERGLEREIVKFVKKRWSGYEDLIWFLNPVQLQSCPAIAHFHVFVKTQDCVGW